MNDFVVAIRALGEAAGLLYKELLNQGFTREEAIRLVQTYITATLTQPKRNKEDN